ncbi:hypothetical protein ACPVTF_06190 [Geobacillus icigianus]|nr:MULTISPECIES: hypothetical protein [Geobacillus]
MPVELFRSILCASAREKMQDETATAANNSLKNKPFSYYYK